MSSSFTSRPDFFMRQRVAGIPSPHTPSKPESRQSCFRTGLLKVGLPGAKECLSEKDPTIADQLKPMAYATGQFGKNHVGSQELAGALHDGRHRWVVEADIRGFFEHLNHDWLEKMLERRIADRSLIRIIRKWLNAGVMEELNHWSPSTEGTPQGGIISPLLGNIYLHFVQDLWIKKVMARQSKGSVQFRRYACGWLHNPNYWRVRRVTNADIEGKAHTVTTLQFTHLMLAYGAYYKELWDALKAED